MFDFIKTAFSGILSKVMFASILGLGAFSIYQYWQNDRINDKLTQKENDLTMLSSQHVLLQGQYSDLEKQLKQLKESNKITSDVLDKNTKTKTVYKDRFDLVDQLVNSKVDEIKKKYADKDQTIENKKAEDSEVSVVRINGLWDSFCANNQTSTHCPKK